ncbi:Rec8 like protein-domain-containing protein [Annulohypoxylon maeteangense]|uniref:Rec8 like protein-domain-containing protein n=1 Tax=Annulohypoxylon maeteangense TaxID=1927788 RepID=UPI0020084776|nr:Rec8 like protein-domain-containing protein [Annulohypoxylon maeteangense]KAI0886241.1 Rec8 like protein-domain-containing protein [Annulohypoxylon maeteangense]
MFYSHEILMSRQYGVATIWLVATIGSGGGKKRVTKKAIQDVDVQKACGKIIEPGAPVALRLQGQLLYGVSRVYSQQCGYMLSELQKIHTNMHIFFTKFGENQLDPEAGLAKPENLLIMNDPDFVPDMMLPKFDLDALAASQATQKTSSQMSPLDSTILLGSHTSQSPAPGYDIQFDFHHSSSPGPPGSPGGLQGLSSARKPEREQRMLPEDDIFGGAGDWGMEIDEHGNIIEVEEPAIVQDDFDLPPFPAMEGGIQERLNAEQQKQPAVDDEGDVIMTDNAQQAGDVATAHPPSEHHNAFLSDDHHQQHQAPSRRKRKPRTLHADAETQISRTAINKWQEDYLVNCGGPKIRATGAAKAKANAMLLTFGLGLGNIGRNIGGPGMIHPLALDFSGDSLFTAITGLAVHGAPRGQRRSASESIEDGSEQGRRVRPRLEGDDVQLGRSDDVFAQDGQQLHDSPEVGREAQAAMSDHLSSALNMPWNRGSSNIPGSSLRGSAQKGRIPSSPLAGRGNIQDIVRFSDAPSLDNDGGGFDFGGGFPSDNDAFDGFNLSPKGAKHPSPHQSEPQNTNAWPTLDIEGKNFLSFMHSAIRENGERRLDEDFDIDRRWVAFDDLFVPRDTNRQTAAQAFFHVLCLTTKGRLQAQQDGAPQVPFGGIWVGVKMGEVGAGG